MATIQPGRCTDDHDGEVVVFLIGMRINRLWKIHKWLPTALAMPPMMRELAQRPELGFLGAEQFRRGRTVLSVQYWRSFEDLTRFARAKDEPHLPAWRAFNQRVGSSGDVGVYHETYLVPARAHESVYVNMPAFGLGAVSGAVPVGRRGESAAERAGRATEDRVAAPAPA